VTPLNLLEYYGLKGVTDLSTSTEYSDQFISPSSAPIPPNHSFVQILVDFGNLFFIG